MELVMKWIFRKALVSIILLIFSVSCFAENTPTQETSVQQDQDKTTQQDPVVKNTDAQEDTAQETPVVAAKPPSLLAQLRTPTQANWFVAGGVGGQHPTFNHSTTSINNNSGFPFPYSQDIYSIQRDYQRLATLSAGRRWKRDTYWFPSYSVGVLYQHTFATNAGNTIMQYSTPAFTNYAYNLDVSSNIFLAILKLNIFQFDGTSPYLCGGVGGAFNRINDYKEAPMPGLSVSRVSPGFASESTSAFAYNIYVGAII